MRRARHSSISSRSRSRGPRMPNSRVCNCAHCTAGPRPLRARRWGRRSPTQFGWGRDSGSAPPPWREVWTAPGWVIYPELTMTSVETANPGYGLHGPQTSPDGKCCRSSSANEGTRTSPLRFKLLQRLSARLGGSKAAQVLLDMVRLCRKVPSGGSIRIIAPDDYYFGPLIETADTRLDLSPNSVLLSPGFRAPSAILSAC